jgi:uncharacterized membrane protein
MYYEHMGPHMWLHGIGSVLFWLFIIAIVVMIVRHFRSGKHRAWTEHCRHKSEAMTLLETRYVQGEIDRDEFFSKKRDLQGKDVPPDDAGPTPTAA